VHEAVWSSRARRDLRELIQYIAEDSPQNAELVKTRISKSIELLCTMPQAGRIGRVSGTHECVVSKTPYIVVYRISPIQIDIMRVLRGARKWPESSKAKQ